MKKHRRSVFMPGVICAGVIAGICWCSKPVVGFSPETYVQKEVSWLGVGASFARNQGLALGRQVRSLVGIASKDTRSIRAFADSAEGSSDDIASESNPMSAQPTGDIQTVSADQSEHPNAENTSSDPGEVQEAGDEQPAEQYCTVTDLYLRSSPSSDSDENIVTTIPEGDAVSGTGTVSDDGRWISVTYQDMSGWVFRKYLVDEGTP